MKAVFKEVTFEGITVRIYLEAIFDTPLGPCAKFTSNLNEAQKLSAGEAETLAKFTDGKVCEIELKDTFCKN